MTSSRLEGETFFQLNNILYNDHINKIIQPLLPQFERVMKSYVFFNLFFFLLGMVELVLIVTFFTFIAKSAILALCLAIVFLTFFSYFILKVYYQTKKPEQLLEAKERYLSACKNLLNHQEGRPEHHIALANACCKLADSLHNREYMMYQLPRWLNPLQLSLEKFSCWWHWQDIHNFKELLLMTAVDENIKLVKCEPTSLEVHTSLANAYVMLSGLYVDYRKLDGYDEERWVSPERFSPKMEAKFRSVAERAIEEFKVLGDYAPNDPWVHSQLAYSYRDLQMPKEEIKEYETILKLNPGDRDALYKLGVLYFQQGLNAQGLRIYEELKRTHYQKAESLMEYYGLFKPFVYPSEFKNWDF
jgi:tetratricopeptide (TPR) repeat protein